MIDTLNSARSGLAAQQVGERGGLSRVTALRYLDHPEPARAR